MAMAGVCPPKECRDDSRIAERCAEADRIQGLPPVAASTLLLVALATVVGPREDVLAFCSCIQASSEACADCIGAAAAAAMVCGTGDAAAET